MLMQQNAGEVLLFRSWSHEVIQSPKPFILIRFKPWVFGYTTPSMVLLPPEVRFHYSIRDADLLDEFWVARWRAMLGFNQQPGCTCTYCRLRWTRHLLCRPSKIPELRNVPEIIVESRISLLKVYSLIRGLWKVWVFNRLRTVSDAHARRHSSAVSPQQARRCSQVRWPEMRESVPALVRCWSEMLIIPNGISELFFRLRLDASCWLSLSLPLSLCKYIYTLSFFNLSCHGSNDVLPFSLGLSVRLVLALLYGYDGRCIARSINTYRQTDRQTHI